MPRMSERSGRRELPSWAIGLLGVVGLILVWWVLSVTVFAPPPGVEMGAIPTPWQVFAGFADSGLDFYVHNFGVTLQAAGIGYLWGNGIALVLSALVLVVPLLEGLVMQIATITYCIPIVVIGGICVIIIKPPADGAPSGTAIFLAALSVFFTTVVGALLGLKAADRAALDVVTVYGGSALTQLRKVRLISALPFVLNALQIAVPAAFLGAVLGEFFGKVNTGVGPAMIAAQQTVNSAQLWGIALVSGAISLAGYALVGLLSRLLAPWAGKAAVV